MQLTIKQENFCKSYVETGNASQAYRLAYNAEKMKNNSVNRKAKELLDNVKITARISQLQKAIENRHNITIDSLIQELEQARQTALTAETPQTSAAVAATMGKAKLSGLDKKVNKTISLSISLSDLFED